MMIIMMMIMMFNIIIIMIDWIMDEWLEAIFHFRCSVQFNHEKELCHGWLHFDEWMNEWIKLKKKKSMDRMGPFRNYHHRGPWSMTESNIVFIIESKLCNSSTWMMCGNPWIITIAISMFGLLSSLYLLSSSSIRFHESIKRPFIFKWSVQICVSLRWKFCEFFCEFSTWSFVIPKNNSKNVKTNINNRIVYDTTGNDGNSNIRWWSWTTCCCT